MSLLRTVSLRMFESAGVSGGKRVVLQKDVDVLAGFLFSFLLSCE